MCHLLGVASHLLSLQCSRYWTVLHLHNMHIFWQTEQVIDERYQMVLCLQSCNKSPCLENHTNLRRFGGMSFSSSSHKRNSTDGWDLDLANLLIGNDRNVDIRWEHEPKPLKYVPSFLANIYPDDNMLYWQIDDGYIMMIFHDAMYDSTIMIWWCCPPKINQLSFCWTSGRSSRFGGTKDSPKSAYKYKVSRLQKT